MSSRFKRYVPVRVPRTRYTLGIPTALYVAIEQAATAREQTILDWLLDAALWKLERQGGPK